MRQPIQLSRSDAAIEIIEIFPAGYGGSLNYGITTHRLYIDVVAKWGEPELVRDELGVRLVWNTSPTTLRRSYSDSSTEPLSVIMHVGCRGSRYCR